MRPTGRPARRRPPRVALALAVALSATAAARVVGLAAPPARPAPSAPRQQQQPTAPPPATATIARPRRPAYLPLALALARTDRLPAPPTAPPPTAAATVTEQPPATPTATRTPRIGKPGAQGAPLAFLPALDAAPPAAGCAPRVQVQNVGDEASKLALVFWTGSSACGEAAAGPAKVECSGLLKPGARWTFDTPQLPAGASSGYVASFSVRTLSAVGIDVGLDDVIADYMCELLFFGIVGDAGDEARFRAAYRSGGTFQDVPLDRAYGSPIAVTVERTCPAGDPAAPSTTDSAVYSAPSAFDVDVATPRQGPDGAVDALPYRYPLPAVIEDGHRATRVHVQNAGLECATTSVVVVDEAGEVQPCALLTLAPGESGVVDMGACQPANLFRPDGRASAAAMVAGSGPLAVAVDIVGVAAGWPVLASYTAPGPAQPPAVGAGVGATLLAPMAFEPSADGRTGAEIFVQNVSADRSAVVRAHFLDRSGDPSPLDDRVAVLPPLGRFAFAVPARTAPPFVFASVRIDSQAGEFSADPAAPAEPPPPIAAVILSGRTTADAFAPASPMAWAAADAMAAVLDPHSGTVADATRTNRLALASIVRGKGPTKDAPGRSSRIALQNRVDRPGFTDLVVYFYDGNGLLDYICQKLNEKQVEYIDLNTWGYINPGYQGSALVSAWFWEHDIFDNRGEFVANLVNLGAAYGDTGPGDADGRTWTSASPIAGDAPFAPDGNVPLCGGGGPDLRPPP